VLALDGPYEAIARIVNPAGIVPVGDLLDKYVEWADGCPAPTRDARANPDLTRVRGLARSMGPCRAWPVGGFGPDALKAVQYSMASYRYSRGNGRQPVPYTRTGINQVYCVSEWGTGREIATEVQKHRLEEVRPLRPGRCAAKDKPKRAAGHRVRVQQRRPAPYERDG
jgi:hypothetical protein